MSGHTVGDYLYAVIFFCNGEFLLIKGGVIDAGIFLKQSNSLVGDDVEGTAGIHADEIVGKSIVARQRIADPSELTAYTGKTAVRNECEFRAFVILGVILHVCHAGLLAGPEQKIQVVIELCSGFPESLHDVKAADRCRLVVTDTSSEKVAVLVQRIVWFRHCPVIAGGNYIEVRKNADGVFLAEVILNGADIVLHILRLETFGFTLGEHVVEDLPAAGAERLDFIAFQGDALYA